MGGERRRWPELESEAVGRLTESEESVGLFIKIHRTELPATSAAMRTKARHLGPMTYVTETCYLGATGHGADPRVQSKSGLRR
jgi:hypothetical protein